MYGGLETKRNEMDCREEEDQSLGSFSCLWEGGRSRREGEGKGQRKRVRPSPQWCETRPKGVAERSAIVPNYSRYTESLYTAFKSPAAEGGREGEGGTEGMVSFGPALLTPSRPTILSHGAPFSP